MSYRRGTFCAHVACRRRTLSAFRRCEDHRVEKLTGAAWEAPRFTGSTTGSVEICSPGGFVRDEWHNAEGKPSREGAPAIFGYGMSGLIENEFYLLDGVNHRIGGPATVLFRNDGSVLREEWHIRGALHRLDGPAWVNYDHGIGQALSSRWSVGGVSVNEPSEVAVMIAEWSTERLVTAIGESSYAPALDGGEPRRLIDAFAAGVTDTAGVIEVLRGAPAEWVRAFESGPSA